MFKHFTIETAVPTSTIATKKLKVIDVMLMIGMCMWNSQSLNCISSVRELSIYIVVDTQI